MGLSNKEIILLNFRCQTYLTYISVIWTVAISFFIAILSYIFVSIQMLNDNLSLLIILSLILIFMEIGFVSVYFWMNNKKEGIERIIREN
ncbi:hypothetical protein J4466_04140 [Candidatus Pacearchaeota archaeon]|nr:hypothetical protein [Candidatus Pacearchaeota archaeon]